MSPLRRFTGARRKVGATVAAIVLGAGVAVVAAPLTASAHTGSVSAVATCTTSTGAAVVTYTVKNDWSTVMDISASNNAAIPRGHTIAANSSEKFTQDIAAPAAGTTVSATLSYHWADGTQHTDASGYAEATVAKDCTVPSTPKCITAVWLIPGGDVNDSFAKPEQLVD